MSASTKEAQDLGQAIRGLHAEIKEKIEERSRWLNQWALLVSPWQVGDVVKGHGYSFNNLECRITAVTGRLAYDEDPQVRIVAVVLKQDGSDSSRFTDWTWAPK